MSGAVRTAIMILGAITMFPIVILNWAAPIVSIIWLIVAGAWTLVVVGFMLGIVSLLIFGMFIRWARMAKTRFGSRSIVLIAINLIIFVILIVYSSWIFSAILNNKTISIWPLVLWAYATAASPWTMIATKMRDDPMAIVWPATAQIGGLATLVAIACGANTAFVGLTLFVGCLAGLLVGWTMGSQKVNPR